MAGFRRLGAEPFLSEDPSDIATSTHVMLPGVGAFGSAMERLESTGMADALRERFAANQPTVAICVGLQVLCERSEESPGVRGLGIVKTSVKRFPHTVRVPQLGWNEVKPEAGMSFVQQGFAYFANSYFAESAPEGWLAARADHGGSFIAALERGNCVALQFHPELSGEFGEGVLRRWIKGRSA
jgi:imidazole glycerol phosphate synthase glutamine amidotransferase subunit